MCEKRAGQMLIESLAKDDQDSQTVDQCSECFPNVEKKKEKKRKIMGKVGGFICWRAAIVDLLNNK